MVSGGGPDCPLGVSNAGSRCMGEIVDHWVTGGVYSMGNPSYGSKTFRVGKGEFSSNDAHF